MWQVAYRMSLFSTHHNDDWRLPLKYPCHPTGLTPSRQTRTFCHSFSVKNLLNHEPFAKADLPWLLNGFLWYGATRWYYTCEPQSEGLQSIYHGVICGSGILPGVPDSLGHAWMYGADSGAGCHFSGLINEEQGPVFNVFNMGRRRGRHTLATHPSLWLMKSPAVLSHFRTHSKMRWKQFLYLILVLHSSFFFFLNAWLLETCILQ